MFKKKENFHLSHGDLRGLIAMKPLDMIRIHINTYVYLDKHNNMHYFS